MAALAAGENYGLGIARLTGLRPARLYLTLWRLEERGAITSRWETPTPVGRPPRRLYFAWLEWDAEEAGS